MRTIPEINFKLIEGKPWERCVALKAAVGCGVLIDQMSYGYGCNAIEAWALGLPVISNATGDSDRAFRDLFGYYPFLRAGPSEVAAAVRRLASDPMLYKQIRDAGVAHYRRYHAPDAAVSFALEAYDEAQSMHPSTDLKERPKQPPNVHDLLLIEYLGGNTGRTTWIGAETGRTYAFSSKNPRRYIDKRDVPGFLELHRFSQPLFRKAG
jgi:hypothetical protein